MRYLTPLVQILMDVSVGAEKVIGCDSIENHPKRILMTKGRDIDLSGPSGCKSQRAASIKDPVVYSYLIRTGVHTCTTTDRSYRSHSQVGVRELKLGGHS